MSTRLRVLLVVDTIFSSLECSGGQATTVCDQPLVALSTRSSQR